MATGQIVQDAKDGIAVLLVESRGLETHGIEVCRMRAAIDRDLLRALEQLTTETLVAGSLGHPQDLHPKPAPIGPAEQAAHHGPVPVAHQERDRCKGVITGMVVIKGGQPGADQRNLGRIGSGFKGDRIGFCHGGLRILFLSGWERMHSCLDERYAETVDVSSAEVGVQFDDSGRLMSQQPSSVAADDTSTDDRMAQHVENVPRFRPLKAVRRIGRPCEKLINKSERKHLHHRRMFIRTRTMIIKVSSRPWMNTSSSRSTPRMFTTHFRL